MNLKNFPRNLPPLPDPDGVPDLRLPSAPKRLEWVQTEISTTMVHGYLIQIAASHEGVMTIGGGNLCSRIGRVGEEGACVRFEDHLVGEVGEMTLEAAEELCRSARMGTSLWRGVVDLGSVTVSAWHRHLELWRSRNPLVRVSPLGG
mgnify:CR=1 FL=1